jgi:hypothetical protein
MRLGGIGELSVARGGACDIAEDGVTIPCLTVRYLEYFFPKAFPANTSATKFALLKAAYRPTPLFDDRDITCSKVVGLHRIQEFLLSDFLKVVAMGRSLSVSRSRTLRGLWS